MDRSQDHHDAWSQLHGGVPPTGLVGWWVRVTRVLAAPLAARRTPPDAISLVGCGLACLALLPAAHGHPGMAGLLVLVSGLLDGLDGAVALLSGRSTRWGAVLDSTLDRLSDAAAGVALWMAGAPAALCAGGVALAWLHEYVRARAAAVGMSGVGTITPSERPTRVLVAGTFLLAAGIMSAPRWASIGATALAVLGVIGLIQLLWVVHGRLAGIGPFDAGTTHDGPEAGGRRQP